MPRKENRTPRSPGSRATPACRPLGRACGTAIPENDGRRFAHPVYCCDAVVSALTRMYAWTPARRKRSIRQPQGRARLRRIEIALVYYPGIDTGNHNTGTSAGSGRASPSIARTSGVSSDGRGCLRISDMNVLHPGWKLQAPDLPLHSLWLRYVVGRVFREQPFNTLFQCLQLKRFDQAIIRTAGVNIAHIPIFRMAGDRQDQCVFRIRR